MSVTLHITLPNEDHIASIQEMVRKAGGELKIKNLLSSTISSEEAMSKKQAFILAAEKLAELGGIKSIDDPVAWQKEQRKDRYIGRNE